MGLFAHCYHIRDNLTMRPHRLDNANKLSIKSSDINEAYSPNSYCDCCVFNPVSQFVAGGANEGDVRHANLSWRGAKEHRGETVVTSYFLLACSARYLK